MNIPVSGSTDSFGQTESRRSNNRSSFFEDQHLPVRKRVLLHQTSFPMMTRYARPTKSKQIAERLLSIAPCTCSCQSTFARISWCASKSMTTQYLKSKRNPSLRSTTTYTFKLVQQILQQNPATVSVVTQNRGRAFQH